MKPEDIKSIGIMGGGTMGGGISQAAALAGYKVVCRDLTDELVAKTKDSIVDGRFGLKGGVARGKQTQEQMDRALANLTLTAKVEDLRNCDLIIEAVPDNKDLKKKVFAERLDAAKKLIKDMGGELKAFYLTMGGYDIVTVADAPNDESVAKFVLALAS